MKWLTVRLEIESFKTNTSTIELSPERSENNMVARNSISEKKNMISALSWLYYVRKSYSKWMILRDNPFEIRRWQRKTMGNKSDCIWISAHEETISSVLENKTAVRQKNHHRTGQSSLEVGMGRNHITALSSVDLCCRRMHMRISLRTRRSSSWVWKRESTEKSTLLTASMIKLITIWERESVVGYVRKQRQKKLFVFQWNDYLLLPRDWGRMIMKEYSMNGETNCTKGYDNQDCGTFNEIKSLKIWKSHVW